MVPKISPTSPLSSVRRGVNQSDSVAAWKLFIPSARNIKQEGERDSRNGVDVP